jgi:hypothetical protein
MNPTPRLQSTLARCGLSASRWGRLKMKLNWFVAISLVFLICASVFAEAPVLTAKELFKSSDLVCLATVEKVETIGGKKFGVARVTEVWKGKKTKEVRFRAFPEWICDTSDAKQGESVLLFLKLEKPDIYGIVNSGQGKWSISYLVSRVTKKGDILTSVSEYDLLTSEELRKLSWPEIEQKRAVEHEVSLHEFKELLAGSAQ